MPSKIEGKKVGFIGAGAMAEALAKGFIAKQVVDAKDIWCTAPSQSRIDLFRDFGCNPAASGPEVTLRPLPDWHVASGCSAERSSHLQVVKNVDIIFLAVKPQYVSVVIKECKSSLTSKHVLVSFAAGVPVAALKVRLHTHQLIMTNATP